MVEDVEIAARTQGAIGAAAVQGVVSPGGSPQHHIPLTVKDAVELSADARKIVKQLQESQTVAEAFLAHLTDPKRAIEQGAKSKESDLSGDDEDRARKQLRDAMDWAVKDIGWLIDALASKEVDTSAVAAVVAAQAQRDGVGVRPPVRTVLLKAESQGGSAALFVEDLTITLQKGEVVDAQVKRVSLTTVHSTMRDRISDKNQPLVLDVGGQLQEVAGLALGQGGDDQIAFTPTGRTESAPGEDRRSQAYTLGRASDDPRHALLIVREGGKLHTEGTIRVRMDAVLPIT